MSKPVRPFRADYETHVWRPSSGLVLSVKTGPDNVNPRLQITLHNGREITLEVCELDLMALESAVRTLREIKEEG